MKILFLSLFYATSAFAFQGWMGESDIAKINAGNFSDNSIYSTKAKCALGESEQCFMVGKKDARKYAVKLVRQGNFEPPVSQTPCADAAACLVLIGTMNFCPVEPAGDEYLALWGDLNGDSSLEAWCVRRAKIKAIVLDSTLESAVDAADAAQIAEKSAIKATFSARDMVLKDCIRVGLKAADLDPATATIVQLANRHNKVKQCLSAALKELILQRLDSVDL